MGTFIVLVVVFAPRGLMGLAERFFKSKSAEVGVKK
jgi:ABC-type branched-subunit amino acid transport system permease subunit